MYTENQDQENEKTVVTQEQIDTWKAQHRDIFKLECEGKDGFFRTPTRKELSFATAAGGSKDPFKFNEIILKACWLGGDEELLSSDDFFLTVNSQVSTLVQIKESTMVKL